MKNNYLPVALLLFTLSILLHFPHVYSLVGDTNYDFFLHYNWSKEFAANFAGGDLYPRWIFHGRYGLGEPVFITYSPLHYHLISIFELTGLSTWNAMQWVAIITNFAFAWFVYIAARNYVDTKYALLISAAALLNPFLVMLHYKFHGVAWAGLAYLSHGMLLWALVRKKATENQYFNFWAALAIGLAVGAHIISALVNLICYSFYCFAIYTTCADKTRKNIKWAILNWGLTAAVGLLLSAAYLFPALYYLDIIASESWIGDYRITAFAWPTFTLLENEAMWISMQWPIPLPGLLMFLLAVAYVIYARKGGLGKFTLPITGGLFVAASSVFFASELSYIIWTFQNPISQINLPYRFVSVLYTVIAFVSGLLLCHAFRSGHRFWALSIMGAMGFSIIIAVGSLYKASYIDGSDIPQEVIQNQYTYQSLEEDFKQPGYFDRCAQDEKKCVYSHRTAAGFRGLPEYALKWAGTDYMAFAQKDYVEYCVQLGIICQKPERKGSGLLFKFLTHAQTSITLPVFYYPGWKVSMKGYDIPTNIDKATGLIVINLPPGDHVVTLHWGATLIEVIGQFTSIFFLSFISISAFWMYSKRKFFPKSSG
jgi:hypothetical protein